MALTISSPSGCLIFESHVIRSLGIDVEGNDVGSESEKFILAASDVRAVGLNLDVLLRSPILHGISDRVVGEIVIFSDDVGGTSEVLEAVGDVVGKLVGHSLTGLRVGPLLGTSLVGRTAVGLVVGRVAEIKIGA